jgi:hypothetical protein
MKAHERLQSSAAGAEQSARGFDVARGGHHGLLIGEGR